MMHENHLYDLLEQLVQEQKSLWRITRNYPEDSTGCSDCDAFWKKLAKAKEEHVAELTDLVKKHIA